MTVSKPAPKDSMAGSSWAILAASSTRAGSPFSTHRLDFGTDL